MPYYAQVSAQGQIKQMFYQMDNRVIPDMQKDNPTDLFIETDYFGDADCFKYVDGQVVPFEKPVDDRTILSDNRIKRNSLLLSSDWTQLSDVALTEIEKQSWKTYRQVLRDMTEDNFLNSNFPTKP